MEGDDGEPAAFRKQPLAGEQALDQLAELVVHRDAEGLEAARRRMRVARLAADGLFDQARQLGGGGDRLRRACGNDRVRDTARFALLAIGEQQIGQVGFVERVDEIGGSLALPAIRMSSGPSRMKEKPRSASSSCIDETPISSTTPSTGRLAS